ncbi:MAG: metalloregulator ArsR/SmtB family transcription factor [Verrucomicrobia bacterium]|nr:metalloregulator ArsR/SmtB family transcription factor [Verrucomicrobiota bacterium]
MDTADTLKLLSDPTRLRLLRLLVTEELSVAELQDILNMGQSRISSHLGLLRQGELVEDRRDGKKSFYHVNRNLAPETKSLLQVVCDSFDKQEQAKSDSQNLNRILDQRRELSEKFFNSVAENLGKYHCPGRSWEAIGHFLLKLTPSIVIADLGAGEGIISQLLARRAETVFCIDNSKRMVEVGTDLAGKNGFANLHYKYGDIENVPLKDEEVDLSLLSQALHHARQPIQALREAYRILKPGGQIVVIDLLEHQFDKARELYADQWLGFSQNQLYRWLKEVGFEQIEVSVVAKETKEPFFETLLASAVK